MKNGKAPTREQKKIMKAHGLVPENWLVVKNLPDSLEVVSRVSLKKVGGKPKTTLSPLLVRSNNARPSSCSSIPITLLTFGWDVYRHSAA